MLNYRRLVPIALTSEYNHDYEKLTEGEANKINDGSFNDGITSINGECVCAEEVNNMLDSQGKHVVSMIGGDDLQELVCYYTWSRNTIDPTGVTVPNIEMIVDDRKLLAYQVTPIDADVTSAEFVIESGSDNVHIDGSYIVADKEGTATYKVILNGSITSSTATITVSNKPEEFPDDLEHRWIEVSPKTSIIPAHGGTISVTGSYGLTGTYGTRKKIGDISDTITIDANNSTSQKQGNKTYYYNNNTFDSPTEEITWVQEAIQETFTYTYEIHVGKNADNIKDKTISYVWDSSSSNNQDSQKNAYIRAVKNKINSSGETVLSQSADCVFENYAEQNFTFTQSDNIITICPKSENTSYTDDKTGYILIRIREDSNSYCTVQLIQSKAGVVLQSGDAVQFTYNWSEGTDLDQATTVELNSPEHAEKYLGYGGYNKIDSYGWFAGDNTGTGNEYSFIDFTKVSEYIIQNSSIDSTISGKNLIESLQDENGVIKVVCNLYTNWYIQKVTDKIKLSYTMFNRTSDDAYVKVVDKTFQLNGYTEINSQQLDALCFASGAQNWEVGFRKTYTISAKFTYYLNSGIVQFETNKDNVEKWQGGKVWTYDYSKRDIVSVKDISINLQDSKTITCSLTLDHFNINLNEYYSEIQYGLYNYSTKTSIGTQGSIDIGTSYGQRKFPQSISITKKIDNLVLPSGSSIICPYVLGKRVYDFNTSTIYYGESQIYNDYSVEVNK